VWIALGAGAASALAQAPLDLWPVLFLTFPLLVWLIDGAVARSWRGVRGCALVGWCFGFGYFVAGLYWMGYAFLVDAETFAWLLPFAVIGLPACLAVFTALGCACANLLWTRGAARILTLAITLTATEWLRGHVLTGLPWNVFGYALTGPLALAQFASVVGLWGLTFIAVAVFASPATLTDRASETSRPWLPGTEGLLDSGLPQAIAPPIYARFGNGVALILMTFGLMAVLRAIARSASYENN
jgi:apolipoprotein N-acyltransferase